MDALFGDEDMSTLQQMINKKIDQEMKCAITEIKKHIDDQVNLAVVKIEASFSAAMKALAGNLGTVNNDVQDIKAGVGKIITSIEATDVKISGFDARMTDVVETQAAAAPAPILDVEYHDLSPSDKNQYFKIGHSKYDIVSAQDPIDFKMYEPKAHQAKNFKRKVLEMMTAANVPSKAADYIVNEIYKGKRKKKQ
jgi:2-polyprenyl-3-methyl-5-hydroxy-6-metoxy-1,4-benzoquinol methylase